MQRIGNSHTQVRLGSLLRASALVRVALASALIALAWPWPAHADEALWSLLKSGGRVVLMRHAVTTPGAGDPPGFRLDDCSTQRNLTDQGRQDARRVGVAFRQHGVTIERVLSSPWCRCLETANLAFGASEVSTALSNLFTHPQNRDQQVREMRELISLPHKGNRAFVSHGATILALTGVSLGTAEMLVVTPEREGRFIVNGRLIAHTP